MDGTFDYTPLVPAAICHSCPLRDSACPQIKTEWKIVANELYTRWNLPNCLGALDGKHFSLIPPIRSGSTFYKNKHTFSIVLMELVDADCRFLWIDVGCNGRISDGGVFDWSSLQQALFAAREHNEALLVQ